mgnify:CR=1 FL=1
MAEKETIEIYTDGCSHGNPGPGGFGVVLIHKDKRKELSKGFKHTTNNRMELLAVIEALKAVRKKDHKIIIHTDSRLIVDAVDKNWLNGWAKRNWKKADKKPVLNSDLWKQLIPLLEKYDVEIKWVKGHAGIEENERCDELANEAADYPEFTDRKYEGKNKTANNIKVLEKKGVIKIVDRNGGSIEIEEKDVEIIINKLKSIV